MNSGGGAVRLDLHCRNNRIAGNDIEHIGGCGILVAGYGPGTKDVSTSNEITDNYIHHGAEIFWHSPGIMIWQSGANRIANNLIHDLPGMGIVISGVRPQFFSRSLRECSRTIRQHEAGEVRTMEEALPFLHARDNTIENNEIHHVVTMMGDSNAIYISGAGKGNTIRRNYVHDIVGGGTHSAIRTDGWQSGTLITENVIRRCLRAGITRKYDNDVVNNIIIDVIEDSDNPIVKSAFWGYIEFRSFPGETRVKGAKVRRNICFHSGQRANFYHVVNARTRPVDCDTDYNLFFLAADPAAGREFLNEQQSKGIDAHSICADPLFVDLEGGDLRLKQDSPAFSLGIKTVDLAHIGLGREASGR